MRDFIYFYINGRPHKVSGKEAFYPLSTYLRECLGLVGTKVVCSEGDCGACTILESDIHQLSKETPQYKTINSCIRYLYQCDLKHLITVEGVTKKNNLSKVQESMVNCNGAQCGFCTPGFICSLTSLAENSFHQNKVITEKRVKNYTTGNLCRCTGYQPIIDAGVKIDLKEYNPLSNQYDENSIYSDLSQFKESPVLIKTEERSVYIPVDESQVLEAMAQRGPVNEVIKSPKLNSGGTDLGVIENKAGHLKNYKKQDILSLDNLSCGKNIVKKEKVYEIGPRATWTEIEKTLNKDFPEFCRLIAIFASPQIKNVGTLVGNVANGSPIGDGIPFLMVSEAELILKNLKTERRVRLDEFYLGYKKFDLKEDEIISKIVLPIPEKDTIFKLYKASVRKDLDISAVTFATSFRINKGTIDKFKLSYGGVGPIVFRLKSAEDLIEGKKFKLETFENALEEVERNITPLSDHRGSSEYRHQLAKNMLMKCYQEIADELNGEAHS